MRSLGFPLAPMILGVVLCDVAELNISRSLALSSDLTLFVTRPWSLFFLILAAFSLVFPWYQAARSRSRWRSEEHTSELQSLMRISYAVFCLKKKKYQ